MKLLKLNAIDRWEGVDKIKIGISYVNTDFIISFFKETNAITGMYIINSTYPLYIKMNIDKFIDAVYRNDAFEIISLDRAKYK